MKTTILVLTIVLASSSAYSQETAHIKSIQDEPRVATTPGILAPRTVTTDYDKIVTVECSRKTYRLRDSGWADVEVGKDYQVLKIGKDRMDLLVFGKTGYHKTGLRKETFLVEGIAESKPE
jgi:hypothetical protein